MTYLNLPAERKVCQLLMKRLPTVASDKWAQPHICHFLVIGCCWLEQREHGIN